MRENRDGEGRNRGKEGRREGCRLGIGEGSIEEEKEVRKKLERVPKIHNCNANKSIKYLV